jgi:hypothetical protein
MSDKMALKIAIDLVHVPSQVRLFRSEPLPDGMQVLLRIAAGDDEAERAGVEALGRSLEVVRRAATFFIEQILFAPNTNSYRVLGTEIGADSGELRRNVALLMRWLHPDVDSHSERTIFISRVTEAWNNLKTPERRAAYDELLRQSDAKSKSKRRSARSRLQREGGGKPYVTGGVHRQSAAQARLTRGGKKIGFFRRALSVLFQRPFP